MKRGRRGGETFCSYGRFKIGEYELILSSLEISNLYYNIKHASIYSDVFNIIIPTLGANNFR